MIHAREKPRQLPSWVAGDLPAPVDNTARCILPASVLTAGRCVRRAPGHHTPKHPPSLNNPCRVLQFPPSGAASLRAASAEPGGARPLSGLSSTATPRQSGGLEGLRGSALSPEPAYKSVLGRLASTASRDSSPATAAARLDGQVGWQWPTPSSVRNICLVQHAFVTLCLGPSQLKLTASIFHTAGAAAGGAQQGGPCHSHGEPRAAAVPAGPAPQRRSR